MNGRVFANRIAVADGHASGAALPFQVLRLQAEAGERIDLVFASQRRVTVDDHMRVEPAAFAEHDVPTDHAVRSDGAALADLRTRLDDGRGMDRTHAAQRMW